MRQKKLHILYGLKQHALLEHADSTRIAPGQLALGYCSSRAQVAYINDGRLLLALSQSTSISCTLKITWSLSSDLTLIMTTRMAVVAALRCAMRHAGLAGLQKWPSGLLCGMSIGIYQFAPNVFLISSI